MYKLIENAEGITFAGEMISVKEPDYIVLKLSGKSEVCICFKKENIKKMISVDGKIENFDGAKAELEQEPVQSKIIRLKVGISYSVVDTNFSIKDFTYENGKWYAFVKAGLYIWIPDNEIEKIFEERV